MDLLSVHHSTVPLRLPPSQPPVYSPLVPTCFTRKVCARGCHRRCPRPADEIARADYSEMPDLFFVDAFILLKALAICGVSTIIAIIAGHPLFYTRIQQSRLLLFATTALPCLAVCLWSVPAAMHYISIICYKSEPAWSSGICILHQAPRLAAYSLVVFFRSTVDLNYTDIYSRDHISLHL